MIDWLIEHSIRHRAIVVLAAAVCAVAGFVALVRTPMDAVPDLSENQVIVFTNWPGHGPQEVDEQVTHPLSLQLQGLSGVRVVRGSSDVGYSMLHVIFDDRVSFEVARRRVQERLASLESNLPEGVVPRLAADGIPTGQIFWYTIEGEGYDLAQLRALQDWTIAPQLRSVEGVAEVASVGGFVAELLIQVDPTRLALHGLTVRDLGDELARTTTTVGGHVLHKGNAEFVVQLGAVTESAVTADSASRGPLDEWEQRRIPLASGHSLRLGDVATVSRGPATRRGMFEKDGNETVAGIVHLRYGHNPLEVTRAVRARLRELIPGLPTGVRVVPCYDRTPLITGAVATVSRTLIEALLVAAVCVLLVLRHFRAWLVIALTLPLSVLGTFLGMSLLRAAGWVDVQTNIMSLAGIVISIGVLVDSSIVMTENVMHRLRERFGDEPVRGDVRDTVADACRTVGRPVFCSILVMLVSFAPVFALGGIDGRMYHPLAWTKSLALVSVAILAVTLVPALCTLLVRGRMRDETDSALVRGVIGVYRPVLASLLDRPAPLLVLLAMTLVLAAAPLGSPLVFRSIVFGALVLVAWTISSRWSRVVGVVGLIVLALFAEQTMRPIGTELRLPLDEGMVMDMPITIPRASIAQSGDDLKARNMVLCRFPEVSMVTGKAGRADTPFDPAPLDMIETMIEFRARDLWPKRRLLPADAERMTARFLNQLADARLIDAVPQDRQHEIVEAALFRFEAVQRETVWQLTQAFQTQLQHDLNRVVVEQAGRELFGAGQLVRALTPTDVAAVSQSLPAAAIRELALSPNEEALAALWPRILEGLERQQLSSVTFSPNAIGVGADGDPALIVAHADGEAAKRQTVPRPIRSSSPGAAAEFIGSLSEVFGLERSTLEARSLNGVKQEYRRRWLAHTADLNRELHRRAAPAWLRLVSDECFARQPILDADLAAMQEQIRRVRSTPPKPHDEAAHHGLPALSKLPLIDPHPRFDALVRQSTDEFSRSLLLWPHDSDSLAGFGGEMDRALQMPGWTNVWTRPIQNRVDMLATGVNTEVGVRVLGRRLEDVVAASEQIAAVLKEVPGAADVVADPIRGKGVIQIVPDPQRAAELGVSLSDLQAVLEAALSGRVVSQSLDGRERTAVRLRIAQQSVEEDEESLRRLPIPCRPPLNLNVGDDARAGTGSTLNTVPLEAVAQVSVIEGPATIKSENGWLRNYVRLNVRDRSPFDVVADARRIVARRVTLPPGVFVEWTGQYEHAARTRRTLLILMPCVLLIILAILFVTYRDWADAGLMLLSAPGALAGGVLCQWLLGYKFSIAVGVGYIACFGMAAATGIVMLVYLREAVERAGGLERLTLPELKQAVLNGAVHRLRPKLLTEATTILGLSPMLWSTGVGAEVIRPMAAPVLGGILIADEVIDLLLPVLFYHVRRRRWLRLHRRTAGDTTAEGEREEELNL